MRYRSRMAESRWAALVGGVFLALGGCSRSEAPQCSGANSCACYGNGTCNEGLVCTDGKCSPQAPSAAAVPTPTGSERPEAKRAASAAGRETEASLRDAVMRWNSAHRTGADSEFGALYADAVLYYGKRQSRDACISSKHRFMTKYPDFKQEVQGEVRVVSAGDRNARVAFTKQVTFGGKVEQYPSYLELTKSERGWEITTEGDEVTDKALQAKAAKRDQADGILRGDWDGDGTMDTLRLIAPKLRDTGSEDDDFGNCDGPCDCVIVSEHHAALTIENCIGGAPVNEGDLDGRPGDEFGLLPSWWTSCWHGYRVFGLRGRVWTPIIEPIGTHCSQWGDGVDAIEKDPTHPGHVITRSTRMEDFGIEVKSVRVR